MDIWCFLILFKNKTNQLILYKFIIQRGDDFRCFFSSIFTTNLRFGTLLITRRSTVALTSDNRTNIGTSVFLKTLGWLVDRLIISPIILSPTWTESSPSSILRSSAGGRWLWSNPSTAQRGRKTVSYWCRGSNHPETIIWWSDGHREIG